MAAIGRKTSLEELAALVSQALEDAGITAVLSGGGAVSIYTDNEYQSHGLDFVTAHGVKEIAAAITPLGFSQVPGARQFEHSDTDYYVEFPPGPLGFGETNVSDEEATVLDTDFGPLRIVTPTQSVMDRVAAYVHWKDNQSFDQAVMVARRYPLDWETLGGWAEREGIESAVIARLKSRAGLE